MGRKKKQGKQDRVYKDKMVINKQEMAKMLAKDLHPENRATEEEVDMMKRVIDSFWSIIQRETENNNIVSFHGYGKFLTKKRKGHRARNPHTGEEVQIKDHETFVFEPSRSYRRKLRESNEK